MRTLPARLLAGTLLLFMGCQAQDGSLPQDGTSPQQVTDPRSGQQPAGELPACAAPWELVFLTQPQALETGSCSSEVAVRLQEPRGAPVRVDRPVTLTLTSSSDSGQFFADAACTLPLTSVTIPPRDSTARFFFKEAAAGSPEHEVSAAGLVRATQTQRITDPRPPPPPPGPIESTCRLQFPPAAGIACPIATPGTQYYVSATRGNDSNPGTSPEQPWATLGHALQAAQDGTVRVATGTYTEPSVALGRALTVKGGFDDSFSSWDPDRYPTTYTGRVSLTHDGAVFGGFRLVARGANAGWAQKWHSVRAGTFIRNYVELVYSADDSNHITAVDAGASPGATTRVLCNDIYIRGSTSGGGLGTHALTFGANSGRAEASSNRICSDHNPMPWVNYAISGYGSCASAAGLASVTLTNNIIEAVQRDWGGDSTWGVHFYGCHSDMDVILTNNTILSSGMGLGGYAGSSGANIRWKLTNNIIFSEGSRGAAADVGSTRIASSGNNLFFGYANNTPRPAPASSAGDDTSGASVMGTVFQDVSRGDFRPRAGGAAVGTGLNVHGLGAYGPVTTDLAQQPRPVGGAWDRGALLP